MQIAKIVNLRFVQGIFLNQDNVKGGVCFAGKTVDLRRLLPEDGPCLKHVTKRLMCEGMWGKKKKNFFQ